MLCQVIGFVCALWPPEVGKGLGPDMDRGPGYVTGIYCAEQLLSFDQGPNMAPLGKVVVKCIHRGTGYVNMQLPV